LAQPGRRFGAVGVMPGIRSQMFFDESQRRCIAQPVAGLGIAREDGATWPGDHARPVGRFHERRQYCEVHSRARRLARRKDECDARERAQRRNRGQAGTHSRLDAVRQCNGQRHSSGGHGGTPEREIE
jgi:hypothetical protein